MKEKFEKLEKHRHPYIIGELNDNFVKLAKLKGELVWYSHLVEDEMFAVLSGTLMMDFRNGETVMTEPGVIPIVPRGVEHKPWTRGESDAY